MISTELSTLNVFSTLDRHLNMISTELLNVFSTLDRHLNMISTELSTLNVFTLIDILT